MRLAAQAGAAGSLWPALGQQPKSKSGAPVAKAPKLLLFIAVDQFRFDYLTRFRGQYKHGLDRLLRQGANFTNCFYEHMPTVTAIGHSTMLTGASPAQSGIIANEWWDRERREIVTSVYDWNAKTLGAPDKKASSPHRLLVSTVGDELKMARRGESKVIGISIKDRSAILPAGRMADAAYWMDDQTGDFVSSSWYQEDLPAWVKAHNASKPGSVFQGQTWKSSSTGEELLKLPKRDDTMFWGNIEKSPYGNELILQFTLRALVEEKLGQHSGIDTLCVSFSSNDYVGHAKGPDSEHAHDMCLRTDEHLGTLLRAVDRQVGLQNVVVALTADHGVAPVASVNNERKMPGGTFKEADLRKVIEEALQARYGEDKWVPAKGGEAYFLDERLLQARGIPAEEARQVAAEALRNVPHVARVYTKGELLRPVPDGDLVTQRVRNGYYPPRGGDLVLVFEPYWMMGSTTSQTTHGSPFSYDAHVPMLLMGPGIRPGKYFGRAAVNDLAPTLAALLEVEMPAGATGRVLAECLTA